MKSHPLYSKGEVIVFFNEGFSEDFARDLGRHIGYEFVPSDMSGGYLFKTKIGKEKEAAKKFLHYKEFVQNVERRDLRFEYRSTIMENLEYLSKSLDANLEEKDFPGKLKEIRKYIDQELDNSKLF